MARGLNRITLLGNLGRDPELRYTPSGVAVANASLAVNGYANGEEKVEWFRLVFWEKNAENVAQYGHRGKPLLIEGRGQTRKYTNNEGAERETFEVVVSNFVLLGGPGEGQPEGEAPRPAAKPTPTPGDGWGEFEDVPF